VSGARIRRPAGLHGTYSRYTNGCRCDQCRAAKAAYMKARRTEALATAQRNPFQVARGIKHGTWHGYDEHGCRCDPCVSKAYASKSRRVAA
jgi:hypothetical protein